MNYDNLPKLNLSSTNEIELALKGSMSAEQIIELAIYLGRLRKELDGILSPVETALREKLDEWYSNLPEADRETVRTEAGMATYTTERTRDALIDRDETVARLTEEQLRITYKPDLNAMQTILKADDYASHIKKVRVAPRVTIRDTGGDYENF